MVGNVDNGEGHAYMGPGGIREISVPSLNVAVNLRVI